TGTSGRQRAQKEALLEYEFYIPPLREQRKIGEFLSSLDEKIELNNSIISNLEKLAQTLFKRWFIEFEFPNENGEPYKSSRGRMVDSELGMIAEGWHTGDLDDVGKIVSGGTPSKKENEYYTENGISWVTPKDLSTDKSIYVHKGSMDITELGLKNSSAKLYPKGTVLYSSRAPIGYVASAEKPVSTNQGFKSLIPNEGYSSEYIYFLLNYLTPIIESNAGGSTFKEISGKAMKKINIIIPPPRILSNFNKIANDIF